MKLYLKLLTILFLISISILSCGESPLLPILNKQVASQTQSSRPTSDKYDSIWNPTASDTATIEPSQPKTPSMEELLNPDYAWIGVIDNRKVLIVFDKDKYTEEPIVYFASIDTILNAQLFNLYENRSLLPGRVYYDNKNLIISMNPIFFIPKYDNFMDNNFNLLSQNHIQGYTTNIKPADYGIRRNLENPLGSYLSSYMPIDDLKNKVINGVWYSVIQNDSRIPVSTGNNYQFMDNYEISISKGETPPIGKPTANKGWDVWQLKGYDDTTTTNYLYIYDYVYIYIEENRYTNSKGNIFDVMYSFSQKYQASSSQSPIFRLLRYSTKP